MEPMPPELEAALDRATTVKPHVIENWQRIGDEGRAVYSQYIDRARTQRGRRQRAEAVVIQLLDPEKGYDGPLGGGGAMF